LLIVFSVCLASASALESLTREGLGSVDLVLAQSGLLKGLIRTLVFAAGGLVVLAKVGIQIGPMLTALGVGGLAVGLALQNTLSNLFAGVTLIIDRSFGVGDRVKLASGDTGRISDIGWRTVMVTLDSGDTLIIPNGKIAQENVVRLKV
jgi:small-conductance mechanosensitive channel